MPWLTDTDFEKNHPVLIHAKLGAYIAEEKYDIVDPEILSSIVWHTTGKPAMTKLEKIVYIADYIEPLRDKAKGLEEVRKTAFRDLDDCMYVILRNTLEYLGDDPKEVDKNSKDAFAYYKNLYDQRRDEK